MVKTIGLFGSLALLVLTIQSCYYTNAEDIYGYYLNDTISPLDTVVELSYIKNIKPIITSSCDKSGCHEASNADRVQLSSYVEIESAIKYQSLRNRVESGSMPPDGSIDEAEKRAIIRWIDSGYPNN